MEVLAQSGVERVSRQAETKLCEHDSAVEGGSMTYTSRDLRVEDEDLQARGG